MMLLNQDVLSEIRSHAQKSSLYAASHSFCEQGPKIRLCVLPLEVRKDGIMHLLLNSIYSGLVWNGALFQNACMFVISFAFVVVFGEEIEFGFFLYLYFSLVWYSVDCALSSKCECMLQYLIVGGLSALVILAGVAIHTSYLLARRACAMRRLISARGWTLL